MSYENILADAMAGLDERGASQSVGALVDELLHEAWSVEHELYAPSTDFCEVRRRAILAIRAGIRIAREMEDPKDGC